MYTRLVIVTGMSGAGKSSVLNILEDAGYYCVDNLPIPLIKTFCQLLINSSDDKMNHAAIGVDIRNGDGISGLGKILDELINEEIPYEILYLDASDRVLIKRYKETRRYHPLAGKDGSIEDGITKEREKLQFLRKKADYIIDTSRLLTRDLKKTITEIFVQDMGFNSLMVTIMSFGFKFGIPQEADLVFDVRFLPNPYYIEELKKLSGNDPPVFEYVMSFEAAREFADKLTDMIRFLIPNYINEGKNQLVIAIGCTGGRHRSVTFANELYKRLPSDEGYGLRIEHRDMENEKIVKGF
ncbi:MAG TPA: RNase adapter RapZ [Candidatus Alectryocaccobium stercorigallinarum]|jgi:UPF0042 nucleotide-binding protein|nr:RNase adapter RapZ [Candidatus Alectryocaccobium stercorigallinarum]